MRPTETGEQSLRWDIVPEYAFGAVTVGHRVERLFSSACWAGMLIYLGYGRNHSRVQRGESA